MRNKPTTTLLTGILTATAGALVATHFFIKLSGKRNVNVTQANAAESTDLTTLVFLGAEGEVTHEEDVSSPLFSAGDDVITVNPYTKEYAIEDLDGTPLYYSVVSFSWDDGDRTWRYALEGEGPDVGFAEEWLERPKFPMMEKEWRADSPNSKEEAENMHQNYGDEWGEEFSGLGKAAEKQRKLKAENERKEAEAERKYKIDCYLDLYNHGSPEMREIAAEMLAKLSKGEDE